MTWTGKLWKFGTTPDDVEMDALQADITAKANGDIGAPKIKLPGMASNSVDTSQIGAAAVNQSKLSTAIGEVSTTSFPVNITLPGGEYGFYPQAHGNTSAFDFFALLSLTTFAGTSYVTNVGFSTFESGTAFLQQRYMQSSPPYDLGDGEVQLFIFCLIDKVTQEILGTYVARDAPWHNNGPTKIGANRPIRLLKTEDYDYESIVEDALTIRSKNSIRAMMEVLGDMEIVVDNVPVPQSIKQADMSLLPHPFQNKTGDQEVVLLDPLSRLSADLCSLQCDGESIPQLLHNGMFVIGTSELSRASPPGVKTVMYRWR